MLDQGGRVGQDFLLVDYDKRLDARWVTHCFLLLSFLSEYIRLFHSISALAHIKDATHCAHLRPYVAAKDFDGLLGRQWLCVLGDSFY